MKAVKHVTSIAALAKELGLSRQWTHELFRLPDHPKPTKAGHSVAKWKAYVTSRAEKSQTHGSEKARLQIELLKIKTQRESFDLANSRDEIRAEIHGEYRELFSKIIGTFFPPLRGMVRELSARFEGMSAAEIRRLWESRQQEVFDRVRAIFESKETGERNPSKVVSFREERAVAA
jgi:hypothetical protein